MEAAIIVVAPPSVVAVTHERNKNNNTHGKSPNVVKNDFPYYKELFLKEKIIPTRSKYFPLREVPLGNGRNLRESLYDPVISLDVRNFSTFLLRH